MGPEDDAGTAFAAGHASAVADQAAEEAEEAVEAAEEAELVAEAAADTAAAALEEAWDARSAVADLEYRLTARLDELDARVAAPADPGPAAGESGPPPPEKKEAAPAAPKEEKADDDPKPKGDRKYGARSWFG